VVLALVGGPRLSLTQWNDPRLDAEQWLAVHARPGETIEIAGNPKFQARVPRTLSRILTSDDSLAVRPGSPRGTLVLISSIDRYSFTDTPVIRDSWWRELVDGYHIDATFPAPAWARDLTALPVAPMVTIYRRNGSR
jgi:hypothetical protein